MVIVIEGNIGTGKSTLMSHLQTKCPDRYQCYLEPIKTWTEDTDLLERLYRDPKANAFAFEVGSLLNLSQPINEVTTTVTIQERSIFAAYHVFSVVQHLQGNISDSNFDLLTELYKRCLPLTKITGICYLQLDAGIAYERIIKRGRQAEKTITENYVNQLGEFYDIVFRQNQSGFKIPITIIDAKLPTVEIAEKLHQFSFVVNQTQYQDSIPSIW